MKRYRVSNEASRDLDEVFAYWGTRAGPDIAERLIDAITEAFRLVIDATELFLIEVRTVYQKHGVSFEES